MIFLNGIHGSGKSFLCNKLKPYDISTYSASQLIAEYKNEKYTCTKFIDNIDDNQLALIEMVNKLDYGSTYILDGHLCLLNANREICRISSDVIKELNPKIIITKISSPDVIYERLKSRDNCEYDTDFLHAFQNEEIQYAKEISEILNIQHFTLNDEYIIDDIIRDIRGV